MEIFPVFYKKILESFDEFHLRYLIIGGFATNFHGVIRTTLDMDLWVDKKGNNLDNLFESFISLGYSEESCKQAVDAFTTNHMIKIPFEDNLVEIMDDFITKMDFDRTYENRVVMELGSFYYYVIGMEDLITMKSKTNRYRDLLDVKELKEIRNDTNASR